MPPSWVCMYVCYYVHMFVCDRLRLWLRFLKEVDFKVPIFVAF